MTNRPGIPVFRRWCIAAVLAAVALSSVTTYAQSADPSRSSVFAAPVIVPVTGSATVTVVARDASSVPVAGQAIHFAIASGTATLSGGPWVTDAQGRASVLVTRPSAGTVAIRAHLGSSDADPAVTSGSGTTTVVFVTPPEATPNVTATHTGTDLQMTWSAPAANGSPITDYRVQYRPYPLTGGGAWTTVPQPTGTWQTLSAGIAGLAPGESVGGTAALNASGTVAAIGVSGNHQTNEPGKVRVYGWNATLETWQPVGATIGIEWPGLGSYPVVQLSADGTVMAILWSEIQWATGRTGVLRVYAWDGSAWVQRGADIVGSDSSSVGLTVALSDDGRVVALSHDTVRDPDGGPMGRARVFEWTGAAWVQRGADIRRTTPGAQGAAIDLSRDGRTLAMQANDETDYASTVLVYDWDGSAWTTRGTAPAGSLPSTRIVTIALSPEGDRYTSTSLGYHPPTNMLDLSVGQTDVFEWNGSTWGRVGSAIPGARFDVSVSADGHVIAASQPYGDSTSGDNGRGVRIYEWSGTDWRQRGTASEAELGRRVILSGDGRRLLAALPSHDGTTGNSSDNRGLIRFFDWSGGGTATSAIVSGLPASEYEARVKAVDVYGAGPQGLSQASVTLSLSSPGDVMAGSGRVAYTVTRLGMSGTPVQESTALPVYLTTSGTGPVFYAAASGGSAITSVTLAAGASSATFYVESAVVGTFVITASDASPADGATGRADATDSFTFTVNTDALAIIRDYDGTNTVPTAVHYSTAGVTGVSTAERLGAVNSAVAILLPAVTDTTAEVQTVVDAYLRILDEANGSTADGTADDPTAAHYAAIAATQSAALSTAGLSLLNDRIGTLETPAIDTVAEIEALAAVAGRVMTTAAGGNPTPALSAADFTALGITGVTSANVATVAAAIAATADNGTGVDTLAELQALVDAALTPSSTQSQVFAASATLHLDGAATVTAVVRNASGAIVPGQSVFFSIVTGTATLSSGPWVTDARGQASVLVTRATVGTASVRAYLGTGPADPAITSGDATVSFVTAPDTTTNVTATHTGTDLQMTWSAPAANGSPITDYRVQYRPYPLTGGGAWTTVPQPSGTWQEVGSGIPGQAAGEYASSWPILSADGLVTAVAVAGNSATRDVGKVRAYAWNSATQAWQQLGRTIGIEWTGVAGFQPIVQLSADGTVMAVLWEQAVWATDRIGVARVFAWNGSDWVQRGADLVSNDQSGDTTLALSDDGRVVALSSDNAVEVNGGPAGRARIFEWTGSAWVQLGADIHRTTPGTQGFFVDLSRDGHTLAMTALEPAGTVGRVVVYDWNGTAWAIRGVPPAGIPTRWISDVELSPEGHRYTSTSFYLDFENNLGDNTVGQTDVFEWNGSAWVRVGSAIPGGRLSVSVSADGHVMATSQHYGESTSGDGGRGVRIYEWSGTDWRQRGTTLTRPASESDHGVRVVLSGDGRRLLASFPSHDGTTGISYDNRGLVRFYDWSGGGTATSATVAGLPASEYEARIQAVNVYGAGTQGLSQASVTLSLSSPADVMAGSGRVAYTVTRLGMSGTPVQEATALPVYLTTSGTGPVFYAAASGGSAIPSVTLAAGASSATFYVESAVVGTFVITASDASPADGATGRADATDSFTFTVNTDALAIIRDYDGTNTVPTAVHYSTAGVTGVSTAERLGAVNSAVAILLPAVTDTTAEVQTVLDAYLRILDEANGSAVDGTGDDPTAAHYTAIAATQAAALSTAGLSLLNDRIGTLTTPAIDTVAEIEALATVVARVMVTATGVNPTPALSVADFAALGITGVTSANLATVVAAIASTADDGTGVDTLAELQALVDGGPSDLEIIRDYDGTNTVPTQANYVGAGVTGVTTAERLGAVNSAVALLAPAVTDTTAEVQAVVDAYLRILDEANGSAADGTADDPTAAHYAAIAATQAAALSTSGLSLLNDVIGTLTTPAIDTVAEIEALAAVVARVMTTAAGGNPTPALSVADFTTLGITGVTSANLATVVAAIANTADDGTGVDTLAELQTLVDRETALAIIRDYDGTNTVPTQAHYTAIGVTGVTTAERLGAVNSAVAILLPAVTDTTAEVQAVVDAYLRILDEANGNAADGTADDPMAAQYAAIGATQSAALSTSGLSLLNDVIGALTSPAIDTVAEIEALAAVVARVMTTAAGGNPTPALSVADFATLGITGVTSANLATVVAAIANTADDGSGVDTLAELQTLVDRDNALAIIRDYDGTNTVPTQAHYTAIGVTGVTTAERLGAVNSAVALLAPAVTDTTAEVQAVVDAYLRILDEANGSAADGTADDPMAAHYTAIAATQSAALSTSGLSLLNDVIGTLTTPAIDTVAEIEALAAVVARVMTTAAGGNPTPALSVADFATLGITGVTSANLATVVAAIANTADDGAGVDTLAELQTLVDRDNALAIIRDYDGTNTVPTQAHYTAIGVTGVTTAERLGAVNSAVALLAPAVTDTTAEVQAVVDAYLRILDEANGSAADGTADDPMAAHYTAIAATQSAALSTSGLSLLNDVIGTLTTPAIDTVAEIEALAAVVARVMTTAAGGNPTPALSVTDFATLGITGVTSGNLATVVAAIANTADDGTGVDTLADVQSLVSGTAAVGVVLSGPATGAPGELVTLTAQVVDALGRNTVLASSTRFSLVADPNGGTFDPGNLVTLAAGTGTTTIRYQSGQEGTHRIAMTWLRDGGLAPDQARNQGVWNVALTKRSQTLSFAPIDTQGLGSQRVPLDASATSGLSVTFTSMTPSVCAVSATDARLLAAGTCTIRAVQSGNVTWASSSTEDRSFTVLTPTISFSRESSPATRTGGGDRVSLTVSPANTGWEARSTASWVTTTSAGVGSGEIVFSVEPNTSAAARTATITVGGVSHTVRQAPSTLIELRIVEIRDNAIVTVQWRATGVIPRAYTLGGGSVSGVVERSHTAGDVNIFTFRMSPGRLFLRVYDAADTTFANPSNEVEVQVGQPVAPSMPDRFVAGVQGDTVDLAWITTYGGGEPTNVSIDVTGSFTGTFPLGNIPHRQFAGVPAGTYSLRLRAENAFGVSAWSAPVVVTVPSACTAPPPTPDWFSVGVDGRELTALWEPAAGAAPMEYAVVVDGIGTFSFGNQRIAKGTVGPGTYTLSVMARNACGWSAVTERVTVTVR